MHISSSGSLQTVSFLRQISYPVSQGLLNLTLIGLRTLRASPVMEEPYVRMRLINR